MNITLRKAAALQNSINEAIRNIGIQSEIVINEFQSVTDELNRGAEQFANNLSRTNKLTDVLFEIREAVGNANYSAGINTKLTQIARLDKTIQNYTALVSRPVRVDSAVLLGQLGKIKGRTIDSHARLYRLEDSVNTSVLTEADLQLFRTTLQTAKKAKQKLQDEVLELNVRAEIILSGESVKVLQDEGLI